MFQKVVNVYGVERSLNSDFITNLPPSLAVKKLRKSVTIWLNYGQEYSDIVLSK